jgi:glycosyltransferase A (GT-A) superfamily protein (DUF2064 family)
MSSPVLAITIQSTSDPRIYARLAGRIPSEEGRRDLALAFLDDLIDRCRALPGVALRLAVTPPAESLRLDRPLLPSNTFLPQRGTAVADRRRRVFDDLAASGFTRVVMIGGDAPDLPLEYLQQAFDALARDPAPVVLGPSPSGGCYLIGASVPAGVPDVFSGVRWGTPFTIDDLSEMSMRLGLDVHRLDQWNDVTAPDDLQLLAARLHYAPDAAPHTSVMLRKLRILQSV